MAYDSGHAGDLQGSLPCYDHPPLKWRTGLRNEYRFRHNKDYYNLLNEVPWDRNWGRSDVSNWGVGHLPPFNIVDLGTDTPQYTMEYLPSDYRYLPYFDKLPVRHWTPGSTAPAPVRFH